jgi:RNA polymerase sigma-70 factor (sigma-E family)
MTTITTPSPPLTPASASAASTVPLVSTTTLEPVRFDRSETGVDGVRQDERDAFDAFVRARLPELLRFGRALTGSPEAGADLVQDALERTLLAWSRLESRDEPEGYVRIMVNRNISIWRKFGREHPTDPQNMFDARQASHDRPFDTDLWRAIQQLPAKQRAVIALRYYEDMSEAEIARTLGVSVGTIKSQASKAMAKLRAAVPRDTDSPSEEV